MSKKQETQKPSPADSGEPRSSQRGMRGHPDHPESVLSPIVDAIADLRAGKMVILIDDEDRENEGDLCMAAEVVTPEAINFMARFGRGLICLTLTEEQLEAIHRQKDLERKRGLRDD